MRGVSRLVAVIGAVALSVAILGSVTGVCSYVLYEADLVSVDTSADLLVTSILSSLTALPIGFVGRRWSKWRSQDPVLAQAGMFPALGTLGAWLVVVTVALGK